MIVTLGDDSISYCPALMRMVIQMANDCKKIPIAKFKVFKIRWAAAP